MPPGLKRGMRKKGAEMPDKQDEPQLEDENLENQEEQPQEQPETTEETPEEQEEPEADESQEEPEESEEPEPEPEEDEKPISRREKLRVQDLLEKYGKPKEDRKPEQPEALNFRETLEAEEPVYEQLEKQTKDYGQQQYQQGLQQAQSIRWETMLNIDAPNMEKKYTYLDKTSPDFSPALSDAMSKRYLNMVGYDPETGLVQNPGIRWSDFVEAEMELADELAKGRVEKTQRNVSRQAAQTALRPDGSSVKRLNLNQAPESMTDEELDAVINSSLPTK